MRNDLKIDHCFDKRLDSIQSSLNKPRAALFREPFVASAFISRTPDSRPKRTAFHSSFYLTDRARKNFQAVIQKARPFSSGQCVGNRQVPESGLASSRKPFFEQNLNASETPLKEVTL